MIVPEEEERQTRVTAQKSGQDLYVLSAVDGLGQWLVAKDGGWPCWADESTVFFHHQADDGWWSIFEITLSEQGTA